VIGRVFPTYKLKDKGKKAGDNDEQRFQISVAFPPLQKNYNGYQHAYDDPEQPVNKNTLLFYNRKKLIQSHAYKKHHQEAVYPVWSKKYD
jgi:hypothetical protein